MVRVTAMSEKKSKKLVPQLRFKGFTNPWEQRKLGEIGDTYPGLSGKSKEDFGHGDARYITYLNVYQNAVANQDMTDPIEVDNRQHKIRHGDIFFTTSSETPEEVGLSSVWPYNGNNIYLNSFCFGYRLRERINLQFIAHSLRAPQMRSKFIKLAQGISRFNISKTKLMEEFIGMPTANEQDQLGDFFETLDSLIAAHERKLDLLKKKRTYYLRQIFSRRLRFRGFTEPWKQRKLGEIFKVSSEKNINLVFRKDDAISVARMRKITAASDSSDDYMKTYNIFRLGDIAYEGNKSKDYAFGRLVMNTIGDGIVSHVFTVYRPKTPIVIPFMSKYIHSEYVMRNILLRSTSKALAMSSLSSKEFLKQSLVFPEMQEEEQIGCFFNILDSYIEFHVRRIDLLKNMKLAYLQKMFV
jgi:type I restriction enzyme S subunit